MSTGATKLHALCMHSVQGKQSSSVKLEERVLAPSVSSFHYTNIFAVNGACNGASHKWHGLQPSFDRSQEGVAPTSHRRRCPLRRQKTYTGTEPGGLGMAPKSLCGGAGGGHGHTPVPRWKTGSIGGRLDLVLWELLLGAGPAGGSRQQGRLEGALLQGAGLLGGRAGQGVREGGQGLGQGLLAGGALAWGRRAPCGVEGCGPVLALLLLLVRLGVGVFEQVAQAVGGPAVQVVPVCLGLAQPLGSAGLQRSRCERGPTWFELAEQILEVPYAYGLPGALVGVRGQHARPRGQVPPGVLSGAGVGRGRVEGLQDLLVVA
ncbi:unnamed protein product, partial [Ixodes pacificus]